jgi:hypothetical protein
VSKAITAPKDKNIALYASKQKFLKFESFICALKPAYMAGFKVVETKEIAHRRGSS